jgi:hypothetical protein
MGNRARQVLHHLRLIITHPSMQMDDRHDGGNGDQHANGERCGNNEIQFFSHAEQWRWCAISSQSGSMERDFTFREELTRFPRLVMRQAQCSGQIAQGELRQRP